MFLSVWRIFAPTLTPKATRQRSKFNKCPAKVFKINPKSSAHTKSSMTATQHLGAAHHRDRRIPKKVTQRTKRGIHDEAHNVRNQTKTKPRSVNTRHATNTQKQGNKQPTTPPTTQVSARPPTTNHQTNSPPSQSTNELSDHQPTATLQPTTTTNYHNYGSNKLQQLYLTTTTMTTTTTTTTTKDGDVGVRRRTTRKTAGTRECVVAMVVTMLVRWVP